MHTAQQPSSTPLAIVGLGCRFPGADGVSALWNVLVNKVDAVTDIPAERFPIDDYYDSAPRVQGRTVSRHGGFLNDPFGFDAAFFGISPVEARGMDPQQRILLQVVWEALESGGQRPSSLAGHRVGVFVGQATAEYNDDASRDEPDIRDLVGSRLRAVTAGRISYALDARGPSLVLDSACSSSLVAVHAARQSLLLGECELAIAAGVNLILTPYDSIAYSQGGMASPGGHCRFGDAGADGYVRSDGVGAVVLKRLPDALRDGDPVLALLHGSAVTSDGAASGLLLRPSVAGQADMVREACRTAGITPAQLDYVEAHGTGTTVGDDIELRALAEAVSPGREPGRPLLTGSVKSNLGHAEAAAGMAGLIKAVLIARHGVIPASLHLDRPHELLTGPHAPLSVVTEARALDPLGPEALIGVSSFGLSGTNAHVVIGAVPAALAAGSRPADDAAAANETQPDSAQLLVLSARSATSLRRLAEAWAHYLSPAGAGHAHPLRDLCATAALRRDAHPFRLWAIGASHQELAEKLRALAAGEAIADGGLTESAAGLPQERQTVFVFPGQGSQWIGMGRALAAASPAFRSALERCEALIRAQLGRGVLDLLTAEPGPDFPTEMATVQPALWAIQVALTAALAERGVTPDLVIGHSMGEVAAARAAGALTDRDAAAVICQRSSLMDRQSGLGGMLVVELSADQARAAIAEYGERICVAAENAPTATVLAGEAAALAELCETLTGRQVLCRQVQVAVASHSPQMDALRGDLLAALSDLAPTEGAVGLVSTVLGEPLRGPELDAEYWAANLRQPVRFTGVVAEVARAAESVFVEVGAHPLLGAAVEETLSTERLEGSTVATLRRGQDGVLDLARTVGRLFVAGGRVDWQHWYPQATQVVTSLPAYPWDTVRHVRPTGPGTTHAQRQPRSRSWEIELADWGASDWGAGVTAQGLAPVPPAVYLSAILQAAQEIGAKPATAPGLPGEFELREVVFGSEYVPIEEADRIGLRVTITEPSDGGAHRATVAARLPGATELVHCASAELHPSDGGARLTTLRAVDQALARCHTYHGAEDFHALAARQGVQITEPFQAIEQLWHRKGEAVARLRLPKVPAPASWEAGLQPLLAAWAGRLPSQAGRGYLMTGMAAARILAPLPYEFWSLAAVTEWDGRGHATRAEVLLVDPDGHPLARFSGIRLRPLPGGGSTPSGLPGLLGRLAEHSAAPLLTGLSRLGGVGALGALGGRTRRDGPAEHGGPRRTAVPRPGPTAEQPPAARLPRPTQPTPPTPPAAPPVQATQARQAAPQRPADALLAGSATLLGLAATALDPRRPLREHGLDSLAAVRLSQQLRRQHGIELTAGRLLGNESLAALQQALNEPAID
ncbi:type I polyketide synthase [Kitasatospora kifunensis]|uniref:Acyl transferase domain-containing protein n=1 Tax=Kitasatospora kifunensis TaxID=58351 RepID=A0A7W7VVU1_KITKI|nr:type I polyketide synthase [Kitasatospora kifunensis]MBB4924747.1 acyl transferase domain-containing protein [Kitasatospora kifunensis]